jgi:hypothetical protein
MNNYNKYQKYLSKIINFFGGENKLKGQHNLPKTPIDLILYITVQHLGGDASTILPTIHNEYLKIKDSKYKLGIKPMLDSPANNKINYVFVDHNKIEDKIDVSPALNSGKFSAIYELKNNYDVTDTTQYILRLFNREPTYHIDSSNPDGKKYHMCERKKIKEEYELFTKYLINIYQFGVFNVHETGKVRNTTMDYIITESYNTSSNTKVTEFTPEQKYTFLENNIKMLLELRNKNCFLGDYKLANIGWDDHLNIILIDYDPDTIVKIDERLLRKHKFLSKIKSLAFAHTYKPKYIFPDDKNTNVNDTEIAKYDKFSIAGLINIIERLHIKQDLIDLFKLKDTNYDNIFTYEKMLETLPTLKPFESK